MDHSYGKVTQLVHVVELVFDFLLKLIIKVTSINKKSLFKLISELLKDTQQLTTSNKEQTFTFLMLFYIFRGYREDEEEIFLSLKSI